LSVNLPILKGKAKRAQRERVVHNDVPHNGLTLDGLSANYELMEMLRLHSLPDAAAAPHVSRILAKTDGMTVMQYVVSCALNPSQGLAVTGALDDLHVTAVLPGELGLCDGEASSHGNWCTSAPQPDCLDAVSACVIARLNAHDKRVAI